MHKNGTGSRLDTSNASGTKGKLEHNVYTVQLPFSGTRLEGNLISIYKINKQVMKLYFEQVFLHERCCSILWLLNLFCDAL